MKCFRGSLLSWLLLPNHPPHCALALSCFPGGQLVLLLRTVLLYLQPRKCKPTCQPYHNKPQICLLELCICLLCPDCKLDNQDAPTPRSHSSNSHSVHSWMNAPLNEQLPMTTADRFPWESGGQVPVSE